MAERNVARKGMKGWSQILGVVGILLVLVSWFVGSYYPDQQALLWALAVAGGAALVGFAVAERRLLVRAPGSRTARYGANTVAITAAFLGILVLLNVLAVRHNAKWDATEGGLFTLPEQTVKVLSGLDKDVTVTAFFSDAGERKGRMKQLLDNCAEESSHLKVTFVDPDKNPAQAKQLGIREYGTTVFAAGDQTARITETSEEAVTNALVKVTREGKKTIYMLTGHGEHGATDTQRNGYSAAKGALEDQGYAVKDLLLVREAKVPADCDVLVVAGPTKPFLDAELTAIESYLDAGGNALVLLDPQTESGLEPVLEKWGVIVRDDMVIDTMSRLFGGSYTTPILTEYPGHEITRGFQTATFLPLARSLAQVEKLPDGVTFHPLARTSRQAWGETDLQNPKASLDPTVDFRGPLTLAAVVEKPENGSSSEGDAQGAKTQIVVVGDSDFAANTYFNFSGNGDLFQNMIGFLAKEQDLISIRPKDTKPSPLVLSRAQAATLFYTTVVTAPVLLILVGVGIWWRRKNL